MQGPGMVQLTWLVLIVLTQHLAYASAAPSLFDGKECMGQGSSKGSDSRARTTCVCSYLHIKSQFQEMYLFMCYTDKHAVADV